MSQSKAQLVSPVGILTISGAEVSGIITAASFSGDGSQLTGVGLGTTGSINTSGVITATSFVGDGSGLTGVGIGTLGSINTSGIITASAFVGDGSGLTGIGGPLEPITYSPAIGSTDIALATNIVITFNKTIRAGIGSINIREGSASGTVFESFDIGVSTAISISGGQLTITPSSNLGAATTYYTVFDAGVLQDVVGLSSNTLIDNYSFTTVAISYPLFVWGFNNLGQFGQNDRISYSSPVQIPGTQWSSVSSANDGVLATKTDGTLWAWGYNNVGQLGQNNTTQYSSPVQIPGNSWSSVNGPNNRHTLALKTDGTLWAWGGNNYSGQLGQNNRISYSSPVQIPGNQWSYIGSPGSTNVIHSMAIKTDGTLWAWGDNGTGSGKLGQNDVNPRSSPVQIPGTQWSSFQIGYVNSFLIKNDGTLWSCGNNNIGNLAQNTSTTPRSSPVQIPGTQWSSVFSANGNVLAIKTDGTLWSWGQNGDGQLGLSSRTPYSSPVQIPGTQWSSISGDNDYSLALKSDGTLWAWGGEGVGKLGQNTRVPYSSPVQIPGTSWSSISGANTFSLAIKTE